jgi:hypothetical protein
VAAIALEHMPTHLKPEVQLEQKVQLKAVQLSVADAANSRIERVVVMPIFGIPRTKKTS